MHTCPNCLAEMPDEIVTIVPVEEEVFDYYEEEIPFNHKKGSSVAAGDHAVSVSRCIYCGGSFL